MIYSEDAPSLEKELHKLLYYSRINRVNSRKEFFKTSSIELRKAVNERGYKVHFTSRAEAAEYRESQIIAEVEARSVG